jgi:hypothetical protein
MASKREKAYLRQIARLKAAGKLPTLSELSAAVLETHKKFAVKIRRARREHAERTTVN